MGNPRDVIEQALCFSGEMSPTAAVIADQILKALAESGFTIVSVWTLPAIGWALANNDIEDAAQIVRAAQEREGLARTYDGRSKRKGC